MLNTHAFTLDEINQILDQLNAHPGARLQYIGSRYVPILGRKGEDSIEWDNTGTYEPLTIVLYQGNSYTSRQFVPVGIEITNQEYWANTGNYNAQIEQYRQEVARVVSDNNANKEAIEAANTAIANETQAREQADTTINEAITNEAQAREQADTVINSAISTKAGKPSAVNEYSNTPVNSTFVQAVDGELEIKSRAKAGFNSVFPQQNRNPLPAFWIANGYRTATSIKYGNDYTATNVNSTYDDWEPARNHPDTDGKYHIDCTTLALLVMCGIRFNGSTYAPTGANVGNSYPINFFSDVVKDYMNYEYQVLGLDPETEPEHRRILVSELAKMLDDAGELNHLLSGLSAAGTKAVLHPGDIVFLSNTSDKSHYMGIGHCAIVAYNDITNCVVIDSSTNRGGVNGTVNYHLLTDTELTQIHCRVACPDYETIFTDQQMLGPFSGQLTAETPSSQNYMLGGVACVKATETGSTKFTFNITFPDPVGKVTYSETLTQNQVQQIILPPGTSISVTASAQAKFTHWVSNSYMGTFVIN